MKKLIKFEAEWCGPCHAIRPAINEIAEETGIEVEVVDIDKDRATADKYFVSSIPTIVLLIDDVEFARHTGSSPKSAIKKNLGL